jgi:hypothetical protein
MAIATYPAIPQELNVFTRSSSPQSGSTPNLKGRAPTTRGVGSNAGLTASENRDITALSGIRF